MANTLKIPFPLLVTDCSCPGIRAGVLGSNGWISYVSKAGETGAALFDAVKEILARAGLALENMAGFAFCEGPGSTLGIRINAMAIRTWNTLSPETRPIFAYKSLEAAACMIRESSRTSGEFAVFSDFRKNAWNGCKTTVTGNYSKIETVTGEALESWPDHRYFIQQRIHSPGKAPGSELIVYDLKPLGQMASFLDLLSTCEKPTAFLVDKPEFKKWTPERHR